MSRKCNTFGGKLALLAAAGLMAGAIAPAQAADLGGNCCADLEERIAELEATTARKGNRKVSLTVTGWVNEAVFFWDDGVESNAYVGTNSLEQSRVQFVGDAKIDSDWSAGYRLELGFALLPSNTFSQDFAGEYNQNGGVIVRQSHWYVKSKTYGKLAVGLNGTATYHLLDDADITQTRNFSDAEAAPVALARFKIRENGAFVNSLQWRDILQGVNNDTPGQNGRRNIVRYDTPEWSGFTVTASWGEDDMWGVALKYKGEIQDFKLAWNVGYEDSTDENTQYTLCNTGAAAKSIDCQWWGTAATIMHAPTGLYIYGGYGEQQASNLQDFNPAADENSTIWFLQGGIERKWHPLGPTTIFGEYRHDDTGSNLGKTTSAAADTYIQDGSIDNWALGVVQGIDAAAMQMYVVYRHAGGDFNNGVGQNFNLDDFDMVITGARISF